MGFRAKESFFVQHTVAIEFTEKKVEQSERGVLCFRLNVRLKGYSLRAHNASEMGEPIATFESEGMPGHNFSEGGGSTEQFFRDCGCPRFCHSQKLAVDFYSFEKTFHAVLLNYS
jgi:hypothetical protein